MSGPYCAIFALNDATSIHSNSIYGTANFPTGTEFTSTYPNDGQTWVRALTFMMYGNYLDGSSTIKAAQVNKLQSCSQTWNFTFNKSAGSGNGTIDWFLFSSSAGTTATIIKEIQVYWDAPASTVNWLKTLPIVGTYTVAGQTWRVTYQAKNTQGVPYFQFLLVDGSGAPLTLPAGTFDLLAAMSWLRTQYVPGQAVNFCLAGTEWFTGFGNGYEILNGTVTLTFNSISTVYA